MLRKIVALFLAILIIFAFAVSASAHPPVPNKPAIPEAAVTGLHTACSNLDTESVAYHVHFYFLSPHNVVE